MILQSASICLIDLGAPPDFIKGHEQGFTRPCLIIKEFRYLGLVVIIPLTSKNPKTRHYTFVHLKKGTGGLTKDSFALCHQIRSISVDRIIKHIGLLPEKEFRKIQAVLIDILGL